MPSPTASHRPNSPLFSETSMTPSQVTQTHFTLSSHNRALRLSPPFSISRLTGQKVKLRLFRFSRRDFATHSFLPLPSPRKLFLHVLPLFLRSAFRRMWHLLFYSTLSLSDSPISRQSATFAQLNFVPSNNL